jgi:hypothetical protein
VQADQGSWRAGGAEGTEETPIYGPGLASTQGLRPAHWRLVMLVVGEEGADPSCSLISHRAAYVRDRPGPCCPIPLKAEVR